MVNQALPGLRRLPTLAEHWARLEPFARTYGAPGGTGTILLFHGCGGPGLHVDDYARAAADRGLRAVVIDSFGPRGWSDAFGSMFVCTGMVLRGRERAGDVLAAAWGAAAAEGAPPERLILAGWSHGAWSIMDLMTMPLGRPGEAALADPDPALLSGLQALWLGYPYGGLTALSRSRPWVRAPRVYGLAPTRDVVTSARDRERIFAAPRAAGCELELWSLDGAHAFDEPGTPLSWLRYDPPLAAEALRRFEAFLDSLLNAA